MPSHHKHWSIRALPRVTSKKSPNVSKSCPNGISLEKWKILTKRLQKIPKDEGNLCKIIVATGFVQLPKVQ